MNTTQIQVAIAWADIIACAVARAAGYVVAGAVIVLFGMRS